MLDILKSSSKPLYCVVTPMPNGDISVECDPKDLRKYIDMEKVCAIEIHKDGRAYTMCDKGTALVARLASLR
jgi:hypothetical protein